MIFNKRKSMLPQEGFCRNLHFTVRKNSIHRFVPTGLVIQTGRDVQRVRKLVETQAQSR